jgi:hypothetical protein
MRASQCWTASGVDFQLFPSIDQVPVQPDIIVLNSLRDFGEREFPPNAPLFSEMPTVIPGSLDLFIAAVSSQYLWAADHTEKWSEIGNEPLILLTDPQICSHLDNPGFSDCQFTTTVTTVATTSLPIHGFALWSQTQLFGSVSVCSDGRSEGKRCRQLFLPLSGPVNVRKGDPIVMGITRRSGEAGLWYEWALLKPKVTPIRNAGGAQWTSLWLSP